MVKRRQRWVRFAALRPCRLPRYGYQDVRLSSNPSPPSFTPADEETNFSRSSHRPVSSSAVRTNVGQGFSYRAQGEDIKKSRQQGTWAWCPVIFKQFFYPKYLYWHFRGAHVCPFTAWVNFLALCMIFHIFSSLFCRPLKFGGQNAQHPWRRVWEGACARRPRFRGHDVVRNPARLSLRHTIACDVCKHNRMLSSRSAHPQDRKNFVRVVSTSIIYLLSPNSFRPDS